MSPDLDERIRQLRAQGVHTVMTTFTDLHGAPKGKLIPLEGLPDAVAVGAGFSGPSIWGTGLPRMGPRSEYMGRVLPESLRPWPLLPGVAHAVCDGFAGGQPLDTDPRQVLRQQVARLRERGWTLWVGIEPEFFLLRQDAQGRWGVGDALDTLAKPSYDLKAIGRNMGFLDDMRQTLGELGFELVAQGHDSHQEPLSVLEGPAVGEGQQVRHGRAGRMKGACVFQGDCRHDRQLPTCQADDRLDPLSR